MPQESSAVQTPPVVKTVNGWVFGGFSDVDWINNGYVTSYNSFLFCMKCAGMHTYSAAPQQFKLFKDFDKAIYVAPKWGPIFGSNHDLSIRDRPQNAKFQNGLGGSYTCPDKDVFGNARRVDCTQYWDEANGQGTPNPYMLAPADAEHFKIADYEVFALK